MLDEGPRLSLVALNTRIWMKIGEKNQNRESENR